MKTNPLNATNVAKLLFIISSNSPNIHLYSAVTVYISIGSDGYFIT